MANPPLEGDSTVAAVPGVKGTNSDDAHGGIGVQGSGRIGVEGLGTLGIGGKFSGWNTGVVADGLFCGLSAESNNGDGVQGRSHHTDHSGVVGISDAGDGVGVFGISNGGVGVRGDSRGNDAVQGTSHDKNHSGVAGFNDTEGGNGVFGRSFGSGIGVYGESKGNDAVQGTSHDKNHSGVAGFNDAGGVGVFGISNGGIGVRGDSGGNDAVQGTSHDKNHSGVAGFNDAKGVGVFGRSDGGRAGWFIGDVEIDGNLNIKGGGDVTLADCAEDFDIADAGCDATPGSVMVLDDTGALRPSSEFYDKRVVGVVSGAGPFRPAIVLDRTESTANRKPIALIGKVCCKVDAQYGAIQVGDLLTSSPTPGHAMKAGDPLKAFGAVIGKALSPLKDGQGLIPILIALQ